MKMAIISDIHSNLHALRAVLRTVGDVRLIVCAGDVIGYGAYPNSCINVVRERCKAVVKGNHEVRVANNYIKGVNPLAAYAILWTQGITPANMKWLKELPLGYKFNFGKRRFAMFHGSPTNAEDYVWHYEDPSQYFPAGCDGLILGHTHSPKWEYTKKGLFINPGSVGQPRDDNWKASFAVYDTETDKVELKRVSYDVNAAAKAIRKAGLPEFLADRLYTGD